MGHPGSIANVWTCHVLHQTAWRSQNAVFRGIGKATQPIQAAGFPGLVVDRTIALFDDQVISISLVVDFVSCMDQQFVNGTLRLFPQPLAWYTLSVARQNAFSAADCE